MTLLVAILGIVAMFLGLRVGYDAGLMASKRLKPENLKPGNLKPGLGENFDIQV